jgi:NAD(P)H-dependent FMN reductase
MTRAIHVLGISGSLRRASWNSGLLRAAGAMLRESMSLEIADLSPIPCTTRTSTGRTRRSQSGSSKTAFAPPTRC